MRIGSGVQKFFENSFILYSELAPVEAIEHILHRKNCNRKKAARHAGVSYKALLQSIRCYRLGPG
jgi:hypothetical protein